jgi:hypothetical protein
MPELKPAVISALALGLLYLRHRMLVVRVGTSRSCQERASGVGAVLSRALTRPALLSRYIRPCRAKA